jgi:NADH:ubiquinone oxidoreductase subunit 6 (subunit J)
MMAWIAFATIAFVILSAALQVVRSVDLVHTVFWLALTLIGTAALFVHLDAEFLAAVQILLYTGGVVTLMLFGVMLTRRIDGVHILHESAGQPRAIACAVALFAAIAHAIYADPQTSHAVLTDLPETEALGQMIFSKMVLPFELLSLLLLGAMVGAIVLARKVDP